MISEDFEELNGIEMYQLHVDNGMEEIRTYKFFARRLEMNPQLQLYPIQTWLTESQQFTEVRLGAGRISVCTFASFINVTLTHLMDNPYCLLNKVV